MLFNSLIPNILNQAYEASATNVVHDRKTETKKRLDFYHDKQLDYIFAELSKQFSEPENLPLVCLNVVKKITNRLSMVYSSEPARTLENASNKDNEIYKEIVESSALNLKLKQCQRYTKLLKNCFIRPVWRNGKLDIDILTGNYIDIATGNSPHEITAIMITHAGEKAKDTTYSIWTDQEWLLYDHQGTRIDGQENPYKIIPYLPVFDFLPTANFWLDGNQDLISLQEQINLKIIDLLYVLKTQSYGVGWIKAGQAGGQLKVDPGSLIELPENGSLGFESQKAAISEVVEAIDKLIKWACVSHGLSAASMSTEPNEQSGISKIVDSCELMELRQDDISLWRVYEKQLFSLIKTVWNTHNPDRQISEKATLSIDFTEPKTGETEKDKMVVYDSLLAMGLVSPVDLAMRQNPDLQTREQALEYLMKVQEENRLLNKS